MNNNALIFSRVSSLNQKEQGFSLDAQERLAIDYAQRKNLNVARVWKVAESAWHEERVAFKEMLDYAKRHSEITHIIFDITDRMTRNDMDKLKIHSLVKEYGKIIHFSRSNKIYDQNAGSDDEFMLDIEVAVAKKMSNDISLKTRMGLLEKAKQNHYPSVASMGYKNNPNTGHIESDQVRAPHIHRAFELIDSGSYSIDMLVNILYRDGFRNKKNNRVYKSALHYILRNPVYCGMFRWKGKLYQGSHEPIVTVAMFKRVQAILSGKNRPAMTRRQFAFSNLLVCGVCGCKITAEIKKSKFIYYHCTNSKPGIKDHRVYVREEKLSDLIRDALSNLVLPQSLADLLSEAAKECLQNRQRTCQDSLKNLLAQQTLIQNRISQLYDAKFDGTMKEEIFRLKEEQYNRELMDIKAKTNETSDIKPQTWSDVCKTFELCKSLISLYDAATLQERAQFAKIMASNFTLCGTTLCATYRKPFTFFANTPTRSEWLPDLDEFRNWLISPQANDDLRLINSSRPEIAELCGIHSA